ncbi:MAG: hypothetical protein A4E71_00133 [Smithella sp. PtaU1.Bin162]|nr:MAG: hypothetical protein A4E71_00133 [Smithella sp. PtaU1.Bin162]
MHYSMLGFQGVFNWPEIGLILIGINSFGLLLEKL